MIVLDTDHISLLQHPDSAEGQCLVQRLIASSDRDIVTTVITVEEQMRGWLQVIARYRELQQQAAYYDKLIEFIRFFAKWRILPLEDSAIQSFRRLQEDRVRIATTDLKIAAISVANNATLLSRNMQDFQRVPGLRVEDWTAL
jgi:tRNA(fMet)-specific endonuclease VapC